MTMETKSVDEHRHICEQALAISFDRIAYLQVTSVNLTLGVLTLDLVNRSQRIRFFPACSFKVDLARSNMNLWEAPFDAVQADAGEL